MSNIQQNLSLQKLNTFGVEAQASWFTEINSENDLTELFTNSAWKEVKKLTLGGGSNMLFTKDFDGLVIRMNIQGISHEIQDDQVLVKAGGGVVWNDLVKYCVAHQFSGIENLSLIPGSVGASPIQNIGAYGVELMDVFHSCRAFEIETGQIRVFNNADCCFSYRDSIFKGELKGKYIITEVSYLLSTRFVPHISYGAIKHELTHLGITKPTIEDVSKVVSHIRVSKLPDPSTIGNAGSFFKNPIVEVDQFRKLQSVFPDIVHYPAGDGLIKMAAGWLIEQCGWKGKIVGHTGTWKNQALVIVNHGGATGEEVFNFSSQIIDSVKNRFGIFLEREVNII
ncbi:MAG TPA: UDP-N-acetylmuramate dehydrogenase [Daejeonella sp.]|nr:UDP-N-acetylmuramate dehydrogenase [Daejeonella sp.]